MSKKNLPNIPLYIGDWEKDCNVLSVEAEGAWLRVVFKLWTKGKQNSIKMPAKSLQNLWRCSPEKMQEILDELIFNDIANINESGGFIVFECRRYVRENSLSDVRSKAAKGKQTSSKNKAKSKQITDIDNENEIDNENDSFEKSEKLLNPRDYLNSPSGKYNAELIHKNSSLDKKDFDHLLEQFILSREEDVGKHDYTDPKQIIAGLQKYINSASKSYHERKGKQPRGNNHPKRDKILEWYGER